MPFTFKSKGELGKALPGITSVFSIGAVIGTIFDLINPLFALFDALALFIKAILNVALMLVTAPASMAMMAMKSIKDVSKTISDFLSALDPENLKAFTVMYSYRGKVGAIPESFRKYFEKGIPQSEKPNRRTKVFGLFFIAGNESTYSGLLKVFGPPPLKDKPFEAVSMMAMSGKASTTLKNEEIAGGFSVTLSDPTIPLKKFRLFVPGAGQIPSPGAADHPLGEYTEKRDWEAGKEKKYNLTFVLGTYPGAPGEDREILSYANLYRAKDYVLVPLDPPNFDVSNISALKIYAYEGISLPELPEDTTLNEISDVTVEYAATVDLPASERPDYLVVNWKSSKFGESPIAGYEYEVTLKEVGQPDSSAFSEFVTEFGRGHSFTVSGLSTKLQDGKGYKAIVYHKRKKKDGSIDRVSSESAPFFYRKKSEPVDTSTGLPSPKEGEEYSPVEKEIVRYFVSKGFSKAIPSSSAMSDALAHASERKEYYQSEVSKISAEIAKLEAGRDFAVAKQIVKAIEIGYGFLGTLDALPSKFNKDQDEVIVKKTRKRVKFVYGEGVFAIDTAQENIPAGEKLFYQINGSEPVQVVAKEGNIAELPSFAATPIIRLWREVSEVIEHSLVLSSEPAWVRIPASSVERTEFVSVTYVLNSSVDEQKKEIQVSIDEEKSRLERRKEGVKFYADMLERLAAWPRLSVSGGILTLMDADLELKDGVLRLKSENLNDSTDNFKSLSVRGEDADQGADYVQVGLSAGGTGFDNLAGVYRIKSVDSSNSLTLDNKKYEKQEDQEMGGYNYAPGATLDGGVINKLIPVFVTGAATDIYTLPSGANDGGFLEITKERDAVGFVVNGGSLEIADERIKEGDEIYYQINIDQLEGSPEKTTARAGSIATLTEGVTEANVYMWREVKEVIAHSLIDGTKVRLPDGAAKSRDWVRIKFLTTSFLDKVQAEIFRYDRLPATSSPEIKFIHRTPFQDAAPWVKGLADFTGSMSASLAGFEKVIMSSIGRAIQKKEGVEAMIAYWDESISGVKQYVESVKNQVSVLGRFSTQMEAALKVGTIYIYTYEGPINEMGREMATTLGRTNGGLEGGETTKDEEVMALFWVAEGGPAAAILKFMVGA